MEIKIPKSIISNEVEHCKAEFLFHLQDFPQIESYYFSEYGFGEYIALRVTNDIFSNSERYPIEEGDILICFVEYKHIKYSYEITKDNTVKGLGKIVSVCKDMKL